MATIYTITMTKKEMAKRIAAHCQKCSGRQGKRFCESRDCDLYPIRIMRTVAPTQFHAFKTGDITDFSLSVIRAAWRISAAGPFSFSEVREKAAVEPLSASWWGSVTKTKAWRECFRTTGQLHVSTTKSRSGGAQMVWERREDARNPFDGGE